MSESTDSPVLSADVVSQFDIEHVEFFIDDRWVGKGENRGGTTFQTGIDWNNINFSPEYMKLATVRSTLKAIWPEPFQVF